MLLLNELHTKGIGLLAPELLLVAVSLLVLVLDLVWKERDSARLGWVSIAGLAVAALLLGLAFDRGNEAYAPETAFGIVTVDRFGNFFKLFTCAALAVVMFFVMQDRRERKHRIGEYYFLLLGAGIGIFFMVGTNNLLLLVLGLELLSLASYSLAGFHKSEKRSAEAAMKYVVFGGLSAGVMVFGISLLYGLTGTLDLLVMAGAAEGEGVTRSLAQAVTESPGAVAAAMVLILGGFSYKISVAPFHFWAPDVYEGAPTPVTTFLAVASKAAGFGALLRFIAVLFLSPGVEEAVASYGQQVGALVALLAAVTMTIGNLAALRQESVKRMLAYSSVAHAGYVLVGVAAMTETGFEAAMFYLLVYYLMNLGAFGFLLYFSGETGEETYESLNGLGYKAPVISIATVVFLISLTGLPPTLGFLGKWKLIEALMNVETADYGWLIICLVINSVVSLYYYIRVAKHLFLKEPSEESVVPAPALTGLLVLLAILNVALLLYAKPLVDWTNASFDLVSRTG